MGYIVVGLTLILCGWFSFQRLRQSFLFRPPVEKAGYYLLVKKYEDASGNYFGVFQQGEKEVVIAMSASLYVRVQVPMRGYLKVANQRVQSFE
ncbi:hypothetical protein [Enterococcus saccharolyticus]|uniref:hypothetical protein n=1 Tax=Enterococcus saccharolyticus TaxID=41997 RepID=UPI0039E04397